MLRLIKASKLRAREQYRFLKDLESENGFENNYYGHSYFQYRLKDLKYILDLEKGINLPQNHVPSTTFFLYDNDEIVGVYKVRHYLNEFLRNGPGHIGYAIAKPYRSKGYGSKGLHLAINELLKMKDFKDTEVYLECHKDNPASLKVMQNNGGTIHHEDDKNYHVRIKI